MNISLRLLRTLLRAWRALTASDLMLVDSFVRSGFAATGRTRRDERSVVRPAC